MNGPDQFRLSWLVLCNRAASISFLHKTHLRKKIRFARFSGLGDEANENNKRTNHIDPHCGEGKGEEISNIAMGGPLKKTSEGPPKRKEGQGTPSRDAKGSPARENKQGMGPLWAGYR